MLGGNDTNSQNDVAAEFDPQGGTQDALRQAAAARLKAKTDADSAENSGMIGNAVQDAGGIIGGILGGILGGPMGIGVGAKAGSGVVGAARGKPGGMPGLDQLAAVLKAGQPQDAATTQVAAPGMLSAGIGGM